jgi:hypothetical protein
VAFHAEHAYRAGCHDRVVGILASVHPPVPSDAVARWEGWPARLAGSDSLGPDHPDTLKTRHNLAGSYLSAGRTSDAITILEEGVAYF